MSNATRIANVTVFTCDVCNEVIRHISDITLGYGTNAEGKQICFACCGKIDREAMISQGKATLYLVSYPYESARKWKVTNWPNTLAFPAYVTVGRHNIAGKRYDAYFTGPDGYKWHGVTYGDNSQLCHCKRTKQKG